MSIGFVSAHLNSWKKDLNSATPPYKDRTNKGECSKCGECCSAFMPLTEQDISIIKEHIKANNIQPCHHGTGAELDGYCPFLDSHKLCKIYDVRPMVCRFFKCSRKAQSPRQQKAFINKTMCFVNLWAEFFNDHRLDFIFSKVEGIFYHAAINRKKI